MELRSSLQKKRCQTLNLKTRFNFTDRIININLNKQGISSSKEYSCLQRKFNFFEHKKSNSGHTQDNMHRISSGYFDVVTSFKIIRSIVAIIFTCWTSQCSASPPPFLTGWRRSALGLCQGSSWRQSAQTSTQSPRRWSSSPQGAEKAKIRNQLASRITNLVEPSSRAGLDDGPIDGVVLKLDPVFSLGLILTPGHHHSQEEHGTYQPPHSVHFCKNSYFFLDVGSILDIAHNCQSLAITIPIIV